MTRYSSLVLSILCSVVLVLVSIFGPGPIGVNGVQILEFGTSTSFAETTNNPNIINVSSEATGSTQVETSTAVKTATAASENKAADAATTSDIPMTIEERAKEIEKGTPLDYDAALVLIKYADEYDLNPSLILSVIEVESHFNQWEVGSSRDRGFMQIIPATEKWLAKDFGKSIGLNYNPDRIFDPEYNIGLAAAYLNFLKENYGEDYSRILSEYNRGPSNLKRYYKKYGTYSTSYSRKVLHAEKKYLAFND